MCNNWNEKNMAALEVCLGLVCSIGICLFMEGIMASSHKCVSSICNSFNRDR